MSFLPQLIYLVYAAFLVPFTVCAQDISAADMDSLKKKAEAGDGAAAYMVYINLVMDHGLDAEKAADKWLLLSVRLHNPQGQRMLAMMIKDDHHDWTDFGPTQLKAVEALYKSAAEKDGLACDDLASAYEGGYFGSKDYIHAREYYLHGAQLNVEFDYFPLAKLCHEGSGGPRDDKDAYYWVSVDAQCVDPRSISGKDIWLFREKVASGMSLAELKTQWTKIDEFVSKLRSGQLDIYPPPFDFGTPDTPSRKRESEGLIQKKKEHIAKRCRRAANSRVRTGV